MAKGQGRACKPADLARVSPIPRGRVAAKSVVVNMTDRAKKPGNSSTIWREMPCVVMALSSNW